MAATKRAAPRALPRSAVRHCPSDGQRQAKITEAFAVGRTTRRAVVKGLPPAIEQAERGKGTCDTVEVQPEDAIIGGSVCAGVLAIKASEPIASAPSEGEATLKELAPEAEKPLSGAEELSHVAEEFSHVAEEPSPAAEEPSNAAEELSHAAEEPSPAAGEPSYAAERLSRVEEELVPVVEELVSAVERPVSAKEPFSGVQQLQESSIAALKGAGCDSYAQEDAAATTLVNGVAAPSSVPAYKRFAHLVAPRALPLPDSFAILERVLAALDTHCMVSAGRDQPVIFHRAIRALEVALGRTVTVEHLAAIDGIWSDASVGEGPAQAPASPFKLTRTRAVHDGKRVETFIVEHHAAVTHEVLFDRRTALVSRMRMILFEEHGKFLDSIGVILPEGAVLHKWHPSFDAEGVASRHIDSIVAGSSLIRRPGAVALLGGAGDDAGSNNVGGKVPSDIRRAISESQVPQKETSVEPMLPSKEQSVLERIRMRQQQAAALSIVHDSERVGRGRRMEELVEFSSVLSMLFSCERKTSMLLGDALAKISQGSKTILSNGEIIDLISAISTIVPEWLQMTSSASPIRILRLNRETPIVKVQAAIRGHHREA